jgi:hypothetical protein
MNTSAPFLFPVAAGLCVLAALAAAPSAADAQEVDRGKHPVALEIEGGAMIPGPAALRFTDAKGQSIALDDPLKAELAAFVRLRGGYTFAGRHTLMASCAPLRIHTKSPDEPAITLAHTTISATSPVDTVFILNQYRVGYRYSIVTSPRGELALGLSGNLRATAVSLRAGESRAGVSALGFLPMASVRIAYTFAPPLALLVDGDGVITPHGHFEDILFALDVRIHPAMSMHIGYRLIEGNMDEPGIYTGALHLASTGARVQF